MAPPDDVKLTPVQFEIMQAVWNASGGATVAEIWEVITANREVGRTTVLNLVNRLEARGWLRRQKHEGVYRYEATVDRDAATADVAEKFVDDFFGGSAGELVMSLLGSNRLSKPEVAQLRQLLDQAAPNSDSRQGDQ